MSAIKSKKVDSGIALTRVLSRTGISSFAHVKLCDSTYPVSYREFICHRSNHMIHRSASCYIIIRMCCHFLIILLHTSIFLVISGEMFSLSRLNPKLHRPAHLLICDVQEVFSPLVYRSATVINNIALLNNVANILKIPVIVTEQYPKAFGRTVKVSAEDFLF